MQIKKCIEELKSNTCIEKNEELKKSFDILLNKLEEVNSLHSIMYAMAENVRQESNLDQEDFGFYISLDYKKSPTPELRLNFNNFFYNPINENFSTSYYNLGTYDFFLNFTLFMNKLNDKIKPHMEHFITSATALCNLYHVFINDLFKIENEEKIKEYNAVLAYFKSFKIKKEQVDEIIEKSKKINFKLNEIEFNKKYLTIDKKDYYYTIKSILEKINKKERNGEDISEEKKSLEKEFHSKIFIYCENDFFTTVDLPKNLLIDDRSIDISKTFQYLKLKKDISNF